MSNLSDRLSASKLRADQALARRRKLEAQLDKYNRKRDAKLRFILGTGAIAANLVEQCLQHVSKADLATAREILKEQADQTRTDKPQGSSNT